MSQAKAHGAIWLQHQYRQQAQAQNWSCTDVTAFHPLDNNNGPWSQGLQFAGSAVGLGIGLWTATESTEITALTGMSEKLQEGAILATGERIGSDGGQKLGFYIDNADSIIQNILTLFANTPESFADLDLNNLMNDMGGDDDDMGGN